jgi:hypothetical protein
VTFLGEHSVCCRKLPCCTNVARALYLRASAFCAASCHPFYGEPVDPRLLATFRKQAATPEKGFALSNPPIEPLQIAFDGTTMPAFLIPRRRRGSL